MSDRRRDLVTAIHDSELRIVVAVTGGGVAVVGDLLGVPGASRTVLEVVVPYAAASLEELVGRPVDQAVSETTAEQMALACRARAERLAGEGAVVAGVGCTAALVTDRLRRGDHRAHVAVALGDRAVVRTLELEKGGLDRLSEDRLVADLVLDAIATAAGVPGAGGAWAGAFP